MTKKIKAHQPRLTSFFLWMMNPMQTLLRLMTGEASISTLVIQRAGYSSLKSTMRSRKSLHLFAFRIQQSNKLSSLPKGKTSFWSILLTESSESMTRLKYWPVVSMENLNLFKSYKISSTKQCGKSAASREDPTPIISAPDRPDSIPFISGNETWALLLKFCMEPKERCSWMSSWVFIDFNVWIVLVTRIGFSGIRWDPL